MPPPPPPRSPARCSAPTQPSTTSTGGGQSFTPLLQRRSTILAGSALVIVAVGAYAGALLKTEVQAARKVQAVREETAGESLQRLKTYRANLEGQRRKLVEKIEELNGKGTKET